MYIGWRLITVLTTLFALSCSDDGGRSAGSSSRRGNSGSGGAERSDVGGVEERGGAGGNGAEASGGESYGDALVIDVEALPEFEPSFLRGINLGNRLDAPNEGDWGRKLQAADFATIATRGFDHVRLPVRLSAHALANSPYTIDSSFLGRVDWAIEQALSRRMSLILGVQYYDELMLLPEEHRERFLALWEQLAVRYKNVPQTLAFELLNQPNGRADSVWNDYLAEGVSVVRKTNDDRMLVIDAANWASPDSLPALVLPDDSNLMVAVQLYEPKLFTYQGATWLGPEYATIGIVFPGPPTAPVVPSSAALAVESMKLWFDGYNQLPSHENPSGPGTIDNQIEMLTEYRSTSGHRVYVSEMGATTHGAEESRFRYLKQLRESCETARLGWAVWDDNNGEMAVMGGAAGTFRDSIIDALLPPATTP